MKRIGNERSEEGKYTQAFLGIVNKRN